MKDLKKKVFISLSLMFGGFYLGIGLFILIVLLCMGIAQKLNILQIYFKEIWISYCVIAGCYGVSILLSYGLAWAYTRDEILFLDGEFHFQGKVYLYDEIKKVRFYKCFGVWFLKIKVRNKKSITVFCLKKEELEKKLKN